MEFSNVALSSPLTYPNFPPPVTTGGMQTYIDATGKTWIAKPGVNSGNWKDPRDVLHAKITRNATFTVGSSLGYLNLEGVVYDTYGMFSGSGGIGSTASGFIIPVPGIYRFSVQISCTSTATGQWVDGLARLNQATTIGQQQVWSAGSGTLNALGADAYKFNANDNLTLMIACGTAGGLAGVTGQAATFISVNYLGTG